jgi:hypothetical protein
MDQAEAVGIAVISRAEVAAGLAKAVRRGFLQREEAAYVLEVFDRDGEDLVRLQTLVFGFLYIHKKRGNGLGERPIFSKIP